MSGIIGLAIEQRDFWKRQLVELSSPAQQYPQAPTPIAYFTRLSSGRFIVSSPPVGGFSEAAGADASSADTFERVQALNNVPGGPRYKIAYDPNHPFPRSHMAITRIEYIPGTGRVPQPPR